MKLDWVQTTISGGGFGKWNALIFIKSILKVMQKRQKIIMLSVIAVLILVLIFSIFIYRSFLQKKKANKEILYQKNIIEEKQKEILDSIYYARRIQRALITSEKYIARNLKEMRTMLTF